MDILTTIYVLIAYSGIMTILVLFGFTQTPLKFFLQAKIKKANIVLKKVHGTRMLVFDVCSNRGKGAMKGREGFYFKNEDTGFLIQPGNIPAFLVPGTIAQTYNFDLLALVTALEKRYDASIQSYEDLKTHLRQYNKDYPGKEIKLPAYTAIKPRDIDKLFPENMNIDLQESMVQYEKRKATMFDKFTTQTAIMLFIVLIGAGVAFFLINKSLTGPACPACSCMYEVAKNVTGAVVQNGVTPIP